MLNIFNNKAESRNSTAVSLPESISIYAGNTAKLNLATDKNKVVTVLSMVSLDNGIASVSSGNVIANNVGRTQVITKVESDAETIEIVTDVIVKAGELRISPDITAVCVGEQLRLKAMVTCGVFKNITFQSSDLSVAKVTQDGVYGIIQGLSEGISMITVTANVGNEIKEEVINIKVEEAKAEVLPISNPVSGENYSEEEEWNGSRVYFGVFEQDNNIRNGKEPILWRVLEITDETILLLSEYGLINRFYHDTFENVTWESCSLRTWLNTSFLDIAFTKSEMNAISDSYIKNADNNKYGSVGGNSTTDKVFLLSKKEVNQTVYGFMKGSRMKSKTRTLKSTDYALQEGYASKNNGNTCWWLRSPGLTNQYASYVLTKGNVTDTYFVGRRNDAVRPAIRLKRSSVIFGDKMGKGDALYPQLLVRDFC